MRRILTILLVVLISIGIPAQTRKTTQKKAVASKTTGRTKAKKQTKTRKKTTRTTKKSSQPTNASIKGLQKQRADIRRKIQAQEAQLRRNKADVTKRLNDLMVISGDIETHRRSIDSINRDIKGIQGNIEILESQLATLDLQLKQRRQRYVKAMRYMNRHSNIQDQLMFIFSASSLRQMYRRARFLREYAAYQKAQGEQVKQKQVQIAEKQEQLKAVKGEKHNLLYKGQKAKEELQTKQAEQQKMVTKLKKQQKTIQLVLDEQKKKDAALNQKIEEEIAREVERIRKRAEAEAKRKAEAAEAARKKAAEELARKKAEAQRRAEENARRVAEAKAAEEKAKAEAAAALAARRDKAAKERAEQRAREAEAERIAAERKAAEDKRRAEREMERTKKTAEENTGMSASDRMLSGGFEQNKGRLPMPITGSYRVVSHYGQYTVEGLPNIHLDNKGINILGTSGCAARAIYDGEVSAVYGYGGKWFVMVRHGQYISVYCNLSSASVARGQKVSTRQRLGTVGSDNILQFQLRRGKAKLNPEAWLGR